MSVISQKHLLNVILFIVFLCIFSVRSAKNTDDVECSEKILSYPVQDSPRVAKCVLGWCEEFKRLAAEQKTQQTNQGSLLKNLNKINVKNVVEKSKEVKTKSRKYNKIVPEDEYGNPLPPVPHRGLNLCGEFLRLAESNEPVHTPSKPQIKNVAKTTYNTKVKEKPIVKSKEKNKNNEPVKKETESSWYSRFTQSEDKPQKSEPPKPTSQSKTSWFSSNEKKPVVHPKQPETSWFDNLPKSITERPVKTKEVKRTSAKVPVGKIPKVNVVKPKPVKTSTPWYANLPTNIVERDSKNFAPPKPRPPKPRHPNLDMPWYSKLPKSIVERPKDMPKPPRPMPSVNKKVSISGSIEEKIYIPGKPREWCTDFMRYVAEQKKKKIENWKQVKLQLPLSYVKRTPPRSPHRWCTDIINASKWIKRKQNRNQG